MHSLYPTIVFYLLGFRSAVLHQSHDDSEGFRPAPGSPGVASPTPFYLHVSSAAESSPVSLEAPSPVGSASAAPTPFTVMYHPNAIPAVRVNWLTTTAAVSAASTSTLVLLVRSVTAERDRVACSPRLVLHISPTCMCYYYHVCAIAVGGSWVHVSVTLFVNPGSWRRHTQLLLSPRP